MSYSDDEELNIDTIEENDGLDSLLEEDTEEVDLNFFGDDFLEE